MIRQESVDLQLRASQVANAHFQFASHQDDWETISSKFTDMIQFVPLLDERRRLVGVVRQRDRRVRIGEFTIDTESPTFIIAEIGINHNGSLDQAKRLIDAAVESGADCAKFQMRDLNALYHNSGDANDIREDLGAQYTMDLLSRFQLTPDAMIEAFDHCKARGILPLCTPWDLESLEILERYGMAAYKVASADMTHYDLLRALAQTGKPLICSTGMSGEQEIRETVDLLKRWGAVYVLLHCNSTYPAPFKDINLRYLKRLQEIGECHAGYSGHERGYHVAVASVAMGAKVIEKHFTLDRTMEGIDHKVSLLPEEFEAMVDSVRQVEQAMGSEVPRQITQGEQMNRVTLAKSLVSVCDIRPGETIEERMVDVKSPGRGLQPNAKSKLIGMTAKREIKAG